MSPLQTALLIVAAAPVFLEAANKLERTRGKLHEFRTLEPVAKVSETLRGIGWLCMLVASAGLPFLAQMDREFMVFSVIVAVSGSACLVVRARLQEYVQQPPSEHGAPPPVPEPFDRTQVLRRP